MFQSINIV